MKHKCSICGTEFSFDYSPGDKFPPNFPFCSKRCKLIDLGKWLNEEYRISTPVNNVSSIPKVNQEEES